VTIAGADEIERNVREERKNDHKFMPLTTVRLTDQELKLLVTLATDQLFRREFIDPKMPGYRFDPAELHLGKKLVARLQSMADRRRPQARAAHMA